MVYRSDWIGKIDSPDAKDKVNKYNGKENVNPAGTSFEKILTESFKQIVEIEKPVFKAPAFNNTLLFPTPVIQKGPDQDPQFKKILNVVMKHEGKAYVKEDGGRGASRFGILESTAREFGYKGNIKNISQADAEAIYKKIWDRSGASSLSYPLSLIHFDSYVNSPNAAKKFLEKSDGNVDTYLKMREQRYKRLANVRPQMYARYLKGWMNRVNGLKNIVTEYAMNQSPQKNALNSVNSTLTSEDRNV